LGIWKWNPTAIFDAVHGLDTDGQQLYLSMGINSTIGTAVGKIPVVAALPLDFDSSTQASWSTQLSFGGVAHDVEAEPNGDGLYVVGKGDSMGWVARCTKGGECP
jgi:hypothetical protein